MKRRENCKFTVHPCNFKVKIKEIKPFYVCTCKPIILDLQVISQISTKSCIKIKSKPKHGKLFLLHPATLVYKSAKKYTGYDLFQVLIEDEYGENHTENIFIRVIN